MIKDSEQNFKIFDAHSRDLHGMPHSFGKCTLLTIEGIENLVSYLQISCSQVGVVPFEIKGVFVRDNQPNLQFVQKLNICHLQTAYVAAKYQRNTTRLFTGVTTRHLLSRPIMLVSACCFAASLQ